MNDPACPVIDSEEKAKAMGIAFEHVRKFNKYFFLRMWQFQGQHYAQEELQAIWNLSLPLERRRLMTEYVAARLS